MALLYMTCIFEHTKVWGKSATSIWGLFLPSTNIPDVATFLGCDIAKVYFHEKLGQCGLFVQKPVECVKTSAQVDNLTLLVGQC